MCSCDREVGERFLPYQLSRGTILETQARVPVTLGFVDRVCRECRGLAAESHPMAAIPGRTSKIKRFYWREIMFLTFKRFAERAEEAGLDLETAHSQDAVDLRAEVQREVIEQIKQLHASNPKYDFSELSQSEVLSRHEVEVVRLDASFAPKTQAKGVGIVGNYWGRFTGWPDLFASRRHEFFFAEVKASRDKLSGDQKRWIADNATDLRLPFKLVKINRVATAPG